MKTFLIKPKIYFGDNSLEALTNVTAENAVIFTDAFMFKSGAADKIAAKMVNCKNIKVFSKIVPDPAIELIVEALRFLIDNEADVAVAVGGGSVIDAAKSTVLMYLQKTGNKLPLVAIPTTSGTGSEVTKYAVITDTQAGVKVPIATDELLPDMAILSADLTMSVPPAITADTGFDVMTHALEAYISPTSSDFTDAFAEKAVELCFEYLPRTIINGKEYRARHKMHIASCLAGVAFNDAGLGVTHSIAHALGANFHIPHGRANAMLLPHVMTFNAELDLIRYGGKPCRACSKLSKMARYVGLPSFSEKQGASNLVDEIFRMTKDLGIPQCLSDAGVDMKEYEARRDHIISSALKDACTTTNPRQVDRDAIAQILAGIER